MTNNIFVRKVLFKYLSQLLFNFGKGEFLKFFIETYGCQMNSYDSKLVEKILFEAGFSPVENIDETEILIFNTCTIRESAQTRLLGRVSSEQRRKKNNPAFLIGIIGCIAQEKQEDLFAYGVDFVVGVDNYQNLPAIIKESKTKKNKPILIKLDDKELYEKIIPFNNSYSASLTIIRGCNNFCSYCIVPYVRGRERSKSPEEILVEVEYLAQSGAKEITLLGQNVNSYFYQGINFPKLLKKISLVKGVERIRFMTSHPKDLSQELIAEIRDNAKLCKHIHLPMQAGDNFILGKMNRQYTKEKYLSLIEALRKNIPEIAISTDIIVGFPYEREKEYQETLEMMQKIKFDFAFMYKYSIRKGTKAENFFEQVEEEEKLRRLKELIILQNKISLEKYQAQIGREVLVYVEGVSKRNKMELKGKTDDFKVVVFPASAKLLGKIIRVKVLGASSGTLRGILLS